MPKVYLVNTYLNKTPNPIVILTPIGPNFEIRPLEMSDVDELRVANSYRGNNSFDHKILPRLKSKEWLGLAVFDTSNGSIAYTSWIIKQTIPYFEEFGVKLKANQFLLKDGFCVPHYRHQGLHTRMEQERINFSLKNGASELFIQIHDSNKKGIASVEGNGFKLFKKNYVLSWPIFYMFRNLKAALINPFKRVIT